MTLPSIRPAVTRRIELGPLTVYATVGLDSDGQPRELFLRSGRSGSMERGLLDAFAQLVSLHLQQGGTLAGLVERFRGVQFEPAGWIELNGKRVFAKSILDAVFRWMEERFGAAVKEEL